MAELTTTGRAEQAGPIPLVRPAHESRDRKPLHRSTGGVDTTNVPRDGTRLQAMSRLPVISFESTDPEQRALWEGIVESRGSGLNLTAEDGGMVGPFGAMLQRPGIGAPMLQVGAAVRFHSSLPPQLLELAICTVGARWQAEFEWFAHSRLAIQAGLGEAILQAMAAGDEPVFEDDAERIVHAYASALSGEGKVDQAIYDQAVAALGVDQVVDLTHTIGYYTHICFVLNAFDVPLPPGVTPVWP